MKTSIILISSAIVIGIFALNGPATSPPASEPITNPSTVGISELQQQLRSAEQERQMLREQLHNLQQKMAQHQSPATNNTPTTDSEPPPPAGGEEPAISTDIIRRDEFPQILASLGVDDASIEDMRQRVEHADLEQLTLRNTATREGWYGTERYYAQVRNMGNADNVYREQLGDENYDRFLFASQQTNRVKIRNVMSQSAAEQAGLQADDVVISYAEKRIFNWIELSQATTKGEAGEQVRMEIERDHQRMDIYVPRGALGVGLASIMQQP